MVNFFLLSGSGINIRYIDVNSKIYFVAKDVFSEFNYSSSKDAVKYYIKKKVRIEDVINGSNRYSKLVLIELEQFINILKNTNKLHSHFKYEILKLLVKDKIIDTFEFDILDNNKHEILDNINDVMHYFYNTNIIKQYDLNNQYVIDCYISRYNLIVEFTKSNLEYSDFNFELDRGKYINENLSNNIIFIDSDESIGKSISRVITAVNYIKKNTNKKV